LAAFPAALTLSGCSLFLQAPEQEEWAKQRLDIEWRSAGWRFCESDRCLRPTPKTAMILPSQPRPKKTLPAPPTQPLSAPLPVTEEIAKVTIPPIAPPVTVAALPAETEPAPVAEPQQVNAPVILTFSFASDLLTEESAAAIKEALERAKTASRLTVTGYTDSIGSKHRNERMARLRARAAARELLRQGIKVPIEIRGKGACCYRTSNDTDEGQRMNRRVEILFHPSR
jgi:outer membrane protein OmpA-like peptidoglycan-associated protein